MAFNPSTGFVYLSAKADTQYVHAPDPKWKYAAERSNVGGDEYYDGPLNKTLAAKPLPTGELLAWDPVQQRAAWRVSSGRYIGAGVLATAGNLIFQGRSDGILAAYRASDGKQLWQFSAGTGILAPPVTYLVDGVQYVSVMVGWGGGDGLINDPFLAKSGFGRILTFAPGATAKLNPPAFGHTEPPAPAITLASSPKEIYNGGLLFNGECANCHGLNAVAGPLPDLRYASKEVHEQFESIVLGGARASQGMPSFAKILNQAQVRSIHAYIVSRARDSAKAPVSHPNN
jgi:quinohemoprotein ethanol dehydrogenase